MAVIRPERSLSGPHRFEQGMWCEKCGIGRMINGAHTKVACEHLEPDLCKVKSRITPIFNPLPDGEPNDN